MGSEGRWERELSDVEVLRWDCTGAAFRVEEDLIGGVSGLELGMKMDVDGVDARGVVVYFLQVVVQLPADLGVAKAVVGVQGRQKQTWRRQNESKLVDRCCCVQST